MGKRETLKHTTPLFRKFDIQKVFDLFELQKVYIYVVGLLWKTTDQLTKFLS